MDLAPSERFSSRSEAYVCGRPGYPQALLALLGRECGLTPASAIADIGSGTGLLSRLLLDFGCEVFGVEPNRDMRTAGERALENYPRFHSVNGRAEATTLPGASADLITAAQAFHWFEPAATHAEFQRVLRPGRYAALIWNERCKSPGFMAEYEDLQNQYACERPHPSDAEFDAFFGNSGWRLDRIPNAQTLDETQLRARLASSSWAPKPTDDAYAPMIAALSRLFHAHARDGHVVMEYETRVYYGRL